MNNRLSCWKTSIKKNVYSYKASSEKYNHFQEIEKLVSHCVNWIKRE